MVAIKKIAASLVLIAIANSSFAAKLVAHWKLNETGAPFTDSTGGSALAQDSATAVPISGAGIEGNSAYLRFQNPPGVSTRLFASGGALQTDSFGFSFWIRPVGISPFDNLIAKEMPFTNGIPSYSRLAWQVQIGADNGSGRASLEFVVRGNNRAQGDFFGNVFSSASVPLFTDSAAWIHVAGGYDATTGKLTLFVNGVQASSNGQPGAHSSDGSPFDIGTVRNGTNFVDFAAGVFMDDVQLYDGPLSAAEVAALRANPARVIDEITKFPAKLLVHWKLNEPSPPYGDASGNGAVLEQDLTTTAPMTREGIEGAAAQLSVQNPPGTSTRLYSFHGALQTDSFGFSFWINPVAINPGDNLIAKEMPATNGIPVFSRLAWQVHVGGNNSSGLASLEFLVRGANRAQGDFFGNVFSSTSIPLGTDNGEWIHVAGGYDATTGALTLYVNGVKFVSNNGQPGARNSDGSAFDIGTVRNGMNFVGYAASTIIEDVQLYSGPLSAEEIEFLIANPGRPTASSAKAKFPANLVAHWKLNEASAPYADSGANAISLGQDLGTAAPLAAGGVDGGAAQLRWLASPGVATRLYAIHPALQTDSFGFSFWFNPVDAGQFENLLAKEMPPVGPGYTNLAWQVQVGGDDGSGMAPLEFIVRGTDHNQGSFFGNVVSDIKVPLLFDSAAWVHVAGGYDASSGALNLFVNDVEFVSGNSSPGARNSDGSAFDIGSVRNGPDFIAFAAGADIDDVQLYDAPLSGYDVAFLSTHPGQTIKKPFIITGISPGSSGDVVLTFNSFDGWNYIIEASPDLAVYVQVANVSGVGESTTVTLTKATLDAALGSVRPRTYFRVRAIVEDAALEFQDCE